MPTYEYRCDTCGTVVEAVQGFHDAPLTKCPNCEGTLKKRFGNVGVVFKGSGFYRNDARADRKPSGSKPKSDSVASSPAASTDSGTTTSAPASDSGAKPASAPKSTPSPS